MKTETHTVHFTVDFEGMTRLIRGIWAEGNYEKAINIINSCNVPKEDHNDLIQGKLKMIDANPIDNPGVEGMLEKDDWIPDLSLCQYGMYPNIDEMPKLAQRAMELRKIYVESDRTKARQIMTQLANEVYSLEKSRIARRAREELPVYILEEFGLDFILEVVLSSRGFTGNANSLKAQEILEPYKSDDFYYHRGEYYDSDEHVESPVKDFYESKAELPILDEYIKRQLELDKIESVEEDSDFVNQYGIIDGVGKFYPCGWMEHDWLCSMLGTTKDIAYEDGWVIVSKTLFDGKTHFGCKNKNPNQKQIDTIFDYCEVWGFDKYPDWIEKNS